HGRSRWDQQELDTTSVALVLVRNIRVVAAEIELTARPGWLESREFHVLPLKSHFECVLPEYLGDVIGKLKGRGDLIRRQEGIAAQGLEAVKAERRKSAVLIQLWNTLDAELRRNIS